MNENTFIDLQDTPELLPALPEKALSVPLLLDIALGGLAVGGATPEAVMSTFSTTPVLWPIPPRLAHVGHRELGMRLALGNLPTGLLLDLHKTCRAIVTRTGMGPRALAVLSEALSPKVRHPLMFSPTEASAEAADLFSVEFILAAATPKSKLILQADNISRRFDQKVEHLSTLKLTSKNSPRLTMDWIEQTVYGNRGTVVYTTFDIFDRCYLWAEKNLHPAESKGLMLALSWLKLIQSKSLAYDFEQQVMQVEPFEAAPLDIEFAPLMFTHETLNLARDLWILSEKDDHEAFRDFYGFLVPSYLDDDQFKRLFKTGMVLKENFTDDIRRRVDSGMLNFAGWFLSVIRKSSNE